MSEKERRCARVSKNSRYGKKIAGTRYCLRNKIHLGRRFTLTSCARAHVYTQLNGREILRVKKTKVKRGKEEVKKRYVFDTLVNILSNATAAGYAAPIRVVLWFFFRIVARTLLI